MIFLHLPRCCSTASKVNLAKQAQASFSSSCLSFSLHSYHGYLQKQEENCVTKQQSPERQRPTKAAVLNEVSVFKVESSFNVKSLDTFEVIQTSSTTYCLELLTFNCTDRARVSLLLIWEDCAVQLCFSTKESLVLEHIQRSLCAAFVATVAEIITSSPSIGAPMKTFSREGK